MILTVGSNGYLLSEIIKSGIISDYCEVSKYKGDFKDVAELWYFGTAHDGANVERLYDNRMFFKCLDICQKHNIKMVYASCVSRRYIDNLYTKLKYEHEELIKANLRYLNYCILKIPNISYSREPCISLHEFLTWISNIKKSNSRIQNYS